MARLSEVKGKKIALDTVVFIYALEGNKEFGECSRFCLEAIEKGECRGFASDLVLAEFKIFLSYFVLKQLRHIATGSNTNDNYSHLRSDLV